jgi:muramoyltetrapeptide carboxypeptidase
MRRSWRWPAALAPGARVALVAPAGPLRGADELARAIENARALGWEPIVGEHALAREGYFAGSDAERARDFNAAIAGRADAIWCLRGGYGAMRLLEALDYPALERRPKALIGYSDITALHCAFAEMAGIVTFHGPTARGELTEFSTRSLARATVEQADPCGAWPGARVLRDGAVRGRLRGGNLSLLAALVGTPYFPALDGALLVLEDVNEAVYRIDRMLQHLQLAGALRGCAGILFGDCTHCPESSDDGARTFDAVLGEVAARLEIPCVAGIPVGHIADQWTIPLGAHAELDTFSGTLSVEMPTTHVEDRR